MKLKVDGSKSRLHRIQCHLPNDYRLKSDQVKICSSILLCILGELAGGGVMAVDVGFSDIQQVTGDTRHVTHDMGHLTPFFF